MSSTDPGVIFPIIIVEYNPKWVRFYEEEAALLRNKFSSDLVIRIEHYGSTAVPGLAAKPVIDILMEVLSIEAANTEILPMLANLSYAHDWYNDHIVCFKGYIPHEPLQYHIHMAPAGHSIFDNLLFRDYLRAHSNAAFEYEKLKFKLAERHRNDREAYTDAKADFVKMIINKAKTEMNW